MRSPARLGAVLVGGILAVAACGSGTEPATTASPQPTTVEEPCQPSTADPPSTAPDDPGSATTETTATTITAPTTTATTITTTSAPTTTAEPTTTAPPTTRDEDLAGHQARLVELGYWLGSVDGVPGPSTSHAVTAFQKAEGLPRTGELDSATVERLAIASAPAVRSDAGTVLEIDLGRQLLLVAADGGLVRIYDIATGSSATPTPAGRFVIYRQIDGFRHAPLGTLYRPKYFNGGIALHGYTSVPPQPASHGCVRLTYAAIDHLWASGVAPVGTAVWVY